MSIPVVKLLQKKSYLAMVRNAVKGENRMFQNKYATVDGVEQDILDGGALSCVFFASSVLYINKLIKDMHANMLGLEKDLQVSGWQQIAEPREGAVIIWEGGVSGKKRAFDPSGLHAGFCIGNDRAVSNGSNSTLMPEEHHYTYDGTRKILRIWWHPVLDEK